MTAIAGAPSGISARAMTVKVRILRDRPDIALPAYETAQAAGMDLRSAESAELAPGQILTVGTGLRIEIPEGYEGQVRPRSGLALKNGITMPNAPGTIDADYRGELRVILQNLGTETFKIQPGDRIAQLVVAPLCRVQWEESQELSSTERSAGGFGSTGRH